MTEITETVRLPAPGPEPTGLGFHGATLWIASCEAHRLYAMDPATWTVCAQAQAPGAPFGIAVARGLTSDGSPFWTGHPDTIEMVAFTMSTSP
jgi:hypothetical protein